MLWKCAHAHLIQLELFERSWIIGLCEFFQRCCKKVTWGSVYYFALSSDESRFWLHAINEKRFCLNASDDCLHVSYFFCMDLLDKSNISIQESKLSTRKYRKKISKIFTFVPAKKMVSKRRLFFPWHPYYFVLHSLPQQYLFTRL